jgi:Flp pilus assembly pilin Flp
MILALVAIVVIAALMILGPIIGNVFSTINISLGSV